MPTKIVVLLSLIVFIIGNVVFGLANSFLILSLGRVITAMAAAVFIVKILDMTVVLSEPHIRGKMLALVYMGFSAANVFGIPIGTIIGAQFGWRVIFAIVIVIAILVGLGIMMFVRSEALVDHTPAGVQKSKVKSRKNVALYITVTLAVLIGNYIILGYISPLMTSHGFTLENVSLALLITGIGGMTGTYLGGNLVDKIGPKKTVMIMMSFSLSVCLSCLSFTAHQYCSTSTCLPGACSSGQLHLQCRADLLRMLKAQARMSSAGICQH